MEFAIILAQALRAAAPPGDLKIGLLDDGKLILEHISGAQLLVNPLNIAQLVKGDPQRLEDEAKGAIAALSQSASQRSDNMASRREHLVPVVKKRDWLDAVRKQFETDLLAEGLAAPFGKHLIVTFAFEYDDCREPMTDKQGFATADFSVLLAVARANQERMLGATPERLLVTELVPGDCTFFLRSTNLQAASLILTGLPQQLAARMNSKAASALLGVIVSADLIIFSAAGWGDTEFDASVMIANAEGARKGFGIPEQWGDDVFKIGVDWPALVDPED